MTNTSSNLPVCIHCGTPRPADETLCPNCGHPWIDVSVSDASAAPVAPVAGAVAGQHSIAPPLLGATDDTGEFDFDDWTLPPEPESNRSRWLMSLLLIMVASVIAVGTVLFLTTRDGTPEEDIVATPDTTTTLAPTTTVQSEAPTTVTEAPTSTTTTSTTLAYPSPDAWEAVGDPISVSELRLKASGIGPITLGTAITEAAGALVASLGPPDMSGFDSGFCQTDEWYWIQWGGFVAIFDGYTDSASFIGYRYGPAEADTTNPELETLSGLRLGDTIESLQSTYGSYTVSFEVIDNKDYFRLLDGAELLLWGPVSDTEPTGVVESIYSPDPCGTSN